MRGFPGVRWASKRLPDLLVEKKLGIENRDLAERKSGNRFSQTRAGKMSRKKSRQQ
jgi:hypothetical protein